MVTTWQMKVPLSSFLMSVTSRLKEPEPWTGAYYTVLLTLKDICRAIVKMFSVQSAIFDLGTDLRRSKSAEHEHFGRRQHSHFHPYHIIQNPTGGGKRLKRFMVGWFGWLVAAFLLRGSQFSDTAPSPGWPAHHLLFFYFSSLLLTFLSRETWQGWKVAKEAMSGIWYFHPTLPWEGLWDSFFYLNI